MDAVVQEIDIRTGLVLFEWHALDHVPITESFFRKGAPGSCTTRTTLNSISLDTDGNLIISMRNTWAVYKVDHQTGAVIWTLGSNQNNFKMGPGTQTAFQHDVVRAAERHVHDVRRRRRPAHGPSGSGAPAGRERDRTRR